MDYTYQTTIPNGGNVKTRCGGLGVLDLTTLGLTGGANSMVILTGP